VHGGGVGISRGRAEARRRRRQWPQRRLLWLELGGQGGDDFDRIDADAGDLANQAHDVFRVALAVGIGADAGAFVFGDLVLVDDPFEGGAVAEAVVEGFGRDVGEGEGVVDAERFFVFGELHLFDAAVEGSGRGQHKATRI